VSKTILIVDDNKNVAELIQDWLELVFPDYSTVAVASGVDAIDFFLNEKAEIVIMDINMAGINGIEAARQLKNEHPLTKVIFLSIFDDDVHRCAAHSVGASGYVAKSKINTDFIPLLKKLIGTEACESSPLTP
jgi:DNA-binding NarL/FixJ family response regulator